jgi:hypothetical protein
MGEACPELVQRTAVRLLYYLPAHHGLKRLPGASQSHELTMRHLARRVCVSGAFNVRRYRSIEATFGRYPIDKIRARDFDVGNWVGWGGKVT